ncbi:MAG TPA: choice-of-anchor Q domain-containing protein [Thermoanaerobaculia bacterium]|nr:choice-of-anchor Q domain-containing protein [Thermoanaerobaculia bacterium]
MLLLHGTIASAATYNVSNLNDSGAGSLRQAVLDANGSGGADTITFQAGLTGTITLTTGEIAVTEGLTISGPGAALLSVSGNDASRIFNIEAAPAAPETIAISGLTMTDGLGFVSGDIDASSGGAIRVVGESLSLDAVTVANSMAGGHGAGVAFSGLTGFASGSQTAASLTVIHSQLSGNLAFATPSLQEGAGGGIYTRNAQSVTIDDTEFLNNSGNEGGGGISAQTMDATMPLQITNSRFDNNSSGSGMSGTVTGGAILLSGLADALIEDTEISNNRSNSGGGAGVSVTAASQLVMRRSAVVSNQVSGFGGGGGLLVEQASSLDLENSTIAGNFGSGGIAISFSTAVIDHVTIASNFDTGIIVGGAGATATVTNSILADSLGTNGDIQAGLAQNLSIGYSLVEGALGPYTDLGGNITGVDPQLLPVANNGGPTVTNSPSPTSPVINAGDPAFAPPPTTDQRGFPRVVGGRLDMGAVEVALPLADLTTTKSISGIAQQGQIFTFNISVSNAGPDAAANVVVTDILPPQVTFVSATPSQGSCSGTTTVTCTLGTLNPSATATIAIVVLLTGTGPVTNTATATSSTTEITPGDNSGSATFSIAPAPASVAGVPTLDPKMLFLLAASLAAAAMMLIKKL